MDGLTFREEGLEELERDLIKAISKTPVQAEETLKELAKEFMESAKARAETELNPHERKGEQKKKAIKKKWGVKIVEEGVEIAALIWNSARHFHLVENGHNLVKDGKVIGFVSGKHIMEKTREEYREIVPERFEEMVDDILKGSGLN